MNKTAYKGIVKGKTVVLREVPDFPEGAEVLVTRLEALKGSPQAVMAAINSPPHIKPEDVDNLIQRIEEGKRPVRYENVLTGTRGK